MTGSREKVFIVYSHQDAMWLDRLRVHLKPLERQGLIDRWDDTRIAPGTSWRGEIRKALENVKVAVLLISADFLASDFISENELPPLLDAAEKEGLTVLPVIISSCLWADVPTLARFQAVNSPEKPLSALRKAEQEEVFVRIAEVILNSVSQPAVGSGAVAIGGDIHGDIHIISPSAEMGPGFEEIMRQFALLQDKLSKIEVSRRAKPKGSKRVFIVHGHDNGSKEMVARFLTQLGLEPIILHEQPNEGRAIIEKFEKNADVDYAVVLLTPDDIGYACTDQKKEKSRARQNVILELGYFIGTLGRSRVCALCKGNVEIPSDYHGVVYVTMDDGQGWKIVLAREIKQAGIYVDLNKVI